ncbi:sulfotransferase [Rhodobacteraceae bacterium NNCM2]|nr:sulfotransferase [Coraliihabitans acroporae]
MPACTGGNGADIAPGKEAPIATPVILYGALRSGTTLFRLMLKAHPGIKTPGEADFLFDFIHEGPGGWAYDLDALALSRIFLDAGLAIPDWAREGHDGRALLADFLAQMEARAPGLMVLSIHRHLDKIAALLPDAPVIRLIRDPRDVARSVIAMGWAGTPYYGVGGWIGTEQAWDAAEGLFPPEQKLELRYEDLIRDVEGHLTGVCEFLGLPFDPAMRTYYEGTTYGPPDTRLIEQWKRGMSQRDLGLVEARVGALLTSRGYQPSGAPPVRPGPLHALSNRLAVWRFSTRRYGLGLVLLEKLSRHLGLKGLHRRTRLALHDRVRKVLK